MSEKDYLLTYEKDGKTDFIWFESEDEMNDFINENDIKVLDKIYIVQAVNLE